MDTRMLAEFDAAITGCRLQLESALVSPRRPGSQGRIFRRPKLYDTTSEAQLPIVGGPRYAGKPSIRLSSQWRDDL